jgi:hypothetical protein
VLTDSLAILIPPAPVFIATKWDAFLDRGRDDYLGSHDIEDVITIVAGRPELISELESAPVELRAWLAERASSWRMSPVTTPSRERCRMLALFGASSTMCEGNSIPSGDSRSEVESARAETVPPTHDSTSKSRLELRSLAGHPQAPAVGLRYGPPEVSCRVDPEVDRRLTIGQRTFLRFPVRDATRERRYFG